MKLAILPFLAISAVLVSSYAFGQKNTAFAVTAQDKGTFNWNVLREIDLSTGEVIRTLYDPAVNTQVKFKAVAGGDLKTASVTGPPTGVGVAAVAYDAVHRRLYFTDMRRNELMYFDLATADLNVVVDDNPSFNTGNKFDEANVVTRMAFASDGYGYATTNDGRSLIRFSTGQKPVITNLGEIKDGKKNGTISIHSKSTSWGGDMVGDTYGNLYVITYRNYVFKINPKSKIADYVGQIKGIPAEFTTNGMAVNADGDVIVTSAVTTDNYYKVNMSSLEATVFRKKEDKVFNSSDLANGNFLFQKTNPSLDFVANDVMGNKIITISPNPSTDGTFTVRFNKVRFGKYNIALVSAEGKNVLTRSLNISVAGQVERISLPKASASGMYFIKLIGNSKETIYEHKVLVQ